MSQLTLPAPAIRRILERSPTVLIFRRQLEPRSYEIHNAYRVGKNKEHSSDGMVHLIDETLVFVIQVLSCVGVKWEMLEQRLVRSAGFRTTTEFRESWPWKPGTVYAHDFRVVEDVRYLRRSMSRGSYTRSSSQGLEQALDDADLERFAEAGREQHRDRNVERFERQSRTSRAARLKLAEKREDADELGRLRVEIGELEAAIRSRRESE